MISNFKIKFLIDTRFRLNIGHISMKLCMQTFEVKNFPILRESKIFEFWFAEIPNFPRIIFVSQ